jgi:hypothetical protein
VLRASLQASERRFVATARVVERAPHRSTYTKIGFHIFPGYEKSSIL